MKRLFTKGIVCALIALTCVLTAGQATAAELRLTEPSLERHGITFVAAKDFESSGLARVTFDTRTRQVSITHGNVTVSMTLESRSARINSVSVQAPAAPFSVKGRAMVPLRFVVDALGLPEALGKRLEPTAQVKAGEAVIRGYVFYAGQPLAGIVLRLVRAEDFSFLPEVRARSGPSGAYEFTDVAQGNYRVYAYVGDNKEYFNRVTSTLHVSNQPVKAADIHMGRLLGPLDPPRNTVLTPGRDFVFVWTSCPDTAKYHLTIMNPVTNEEVFSTETAVSHATVPISRLTPGNVYEWRVTATDTGGAFLGGTPGAGAEPLSFSVAVE